MPDTTRRASIVVPAYREADNLRLLAERVFAATAAADIEAELIIVDDDSPDATAAVAADLARRFPVRLIVRRGERGLSGAVLRGFEEAKHDLLLVLDADLQHPPEAIPAMLEPLIRDSADFTIATRYAAGARLEASWPWHRRLNSRVAILLARPLTPLSDPMSGFFALRRSTLRQARMLSPLGFKIALEVYVKSGCRRPVAVHIQFGTRHAGESKLGPGEIVRYLRHLVKLYRHRFPIASAIAVLLAVAAVAFGVYKATS